tara:strand:- start:2417 stop:3268 length:852 start_codon:yes stop_codon:yes gene_type:complete
MGDNEKLEKFTAMVEKLNDTILQVLERQHDFRNPDTPPMITPPMIAPMLERMERMECMSGEMSIMFESMERRLTYLEQTMQCQIKHFHKFEQTLKELQGLFEPFPEQETEKRKGFWEPEQIKSGKRVFNAPPRAWSDDNETAFSNSTQRVMQERQRAMLVAAAHEAKIRVPEPGFVFQTHAQGRGSVCKVYTDTAPNGTYVCTLPANHRFLCDKVCLVQIPCLCTPGQNDSNQYGIAVRVKENWNFSLSQDGLSEGVLEGVNGYWVNVTKGSYRFAHIVRDAD